MIFFPFDYSLESAIADTKKVKELEEFFADKSNYDVANFYDVKIELENPSASADTSKIKRIDIINPEEPFYDDRLFAEKLSSVIVSGYVDLYFTSEEGHRWGYRVMPNKIYTMSVAFVVDDPSYPTDIRFIYH